MAARCSRRRSVVRRITRVKVTAGPHDVGFTWRERPAQRQDVWEPALRDSQEIHMVGGMPKIRTAIIEGPYNVTGVSATPSRDRIFVCRPASAAALGDRPEEKGSRNDVPQQSGAKREPD